MPSPYLANSDSRKKIAQLVRLAHCGGVAESEILEVYHASSKGSSIDERLARVRTFLLFHKARAAHEAMQQRQGSPWGASGISNDFTPFAQAVMKALKKEGDLPIHEAVQILDEIGLPLSGEYKAGTVRFSLSATGDFLSDWLTYVTLHELRHWYNMRHPVTRSYLEEESEAAYVAMKALIVLKEGEPIQWKGERGSWKPFLREDIHGRGSTNKIQKIEEALAALPGEERMPFRIVWAKIKKFVMTQLEKPYLRQIYTAAHYEMIHGKTAAERLEDVKHVLDGRGQAVRLIQEMERLVGGNSFVDGGTELEEAVRLALANQVPLAMHLIDQSMLRSAPAKGVSPADSLTSP
ncbi:MAG: hypothetical protein HY609_02785 [Deltaproteobacteria bacterium]|nr:hypothetical protein [Deltaproteobacteria bacterium]